MNKELHRQIKLLKKKYINEGFDMIGFFGSYVRGEETDKNDLDVLYQIPEIFRNKYPGWDSILRLEEIRVEIEKKLNKKIDMADKNALNKVAKKYILPEVMSV